MSHEKLTAYSNIVQQRDYWGNRDIIELEVKARMISVNANIS